MPKPKVNKKEGVSKRVINAVADMVFPKNEQVENEISKTYVFRGVKPSRVEDMKVKGWEIVNTPRNKSDLIHMRKEV